MLSIHSEIILNTVTKGTSVVNLKQVYVHSDKQTIRYKQKKRLSRGDRGVIASTDGIGDLDIDIVF